MSMRDEFETGAPGKGAKQFLVDSQERLDHVEAGGAHASLIS